VTRSTKKNIFRYGLLIEIIEALICSFNVEAFCKFKHFHWFQNLKMSRLTWMQHTFSESYSKDPNQAAVLLDSLAHRNIADFRYALEVMKCDPNLLDASSGLSVFQTVLQTPKSSEFIKLCINAGGNFYKVCRRYINVFDHHTKIIFSFIYLLRRKTPRIAIQFIVQSNHCARRTLKSSSRIMIRRE
jgi:hypothetical protein